MKTPMQIVREQFPPQKNEPEQHYRARVTQAGVAVFYNKDIIRNVQAYQRAVAACEKSGALMVMVDPHEDTAPGFSRSTVATTSISREDARDVTKYAAAKAAAQREGKELVIEGGK